MSVKGKLPPNNTDTLKLIIALEQVVHHSSVVEMPAVVLMCENQKDKHHLLHKLRADMSKTALYLQDVNEPDSVKIAGITIYVVALPKSQRTVGNKTGSSKA
jgi:hypothetical protein